MRQVERKTQQEGRNNHPSVTRAIQSTDYLIVPYFLLPRRFGTATKWNAAGVLKQSHVLRALLPVGCDLTRRTDRPDLKLRNIARPSCQDQSESVGSGRTFCCSPPLGSPQGTTKEKKQEVIATQAAAKYISVGAGRVEAKLGGFVCPKTRQKLDILITDFYLILPMQSHTTIATLSGEHRACVPPRLVSSGRGKKKTKLCGENTMQRLVRKIKRTSAMFHLACQDASEV